jgi:hypothetical protein
MMRATVVTVLVLACARSEEAPPASPDAVAAALDGSSAEVSSAEVGVPPADAGQQDVVASADGPPLPADAGPAGEAPPADAMAGAPDAGTGKVWAARPGTSWQWQLTGTIDTSFDVQMYDVDLFGTSQAIIDGLHAKGRSVICYFSAGSREDWRPDAAMFPAEAFGKGLDGWPGERWLDTRSEAVRAIMKARLDRALAKKCDGVEPDNVDAYSTDTGFPLTAATQLDYNRFLAREAHARGLSVGLKNDLDQVTALLPDFDWALNEQCLQFDECELLTPFIKAGKAVFHVEYGTEAKLQATCARTKPLGFSTLIKKLDLDAWRVACP